MAKTNPITRFLLTCAGTTNAILTTKGCEIEYPKYAGIGATILFTAVLAALSGGYAMSKVFHNPWLSIGFGLLWGLIIFNLDRFIVSSIRKSSIEPGSSWHKRFVLKLNEFSKALPRLALAVLISIVITKPIELRMFDSEIQGQIVKDLIQERTEIENAVKTEFADIDNLERENTAFRNRFTELQDEWIRRVKVASGELDGWGGTHRKGDGPQHKKREAETKEALTQMNAHKERYDPLIQANERTIETRKALKNIRLEEAKRQIDESNGLLKRLNAFSKLTANNRNVFWANVFIVLLFILLETAPLFVKLLSSRGPYDDHLDTVEHEAYATRMKNISDINDEINTRVAFSKQRNAERLQAELQLTQTTMGSLSTLIPEEVRGAQIEIAKLTVAEWKNQHLRDTSSRQWVKYSTTGSDGINRTAANVATSPVVPSHG